MSAILLGRCYAMRDNLDALIDALEQAAAPPKPICEHPEEMRKYRPGTMGHESGYDCQQCGLSVIRVEDVEAIKERIVRSPTPEGA